MYIRLLVMIFILAFSSSATADSTYVGKWQSGLTDQPILSYYNAKGAALMGSPFDNGSGVWVYKWDFGPAQDYEGGQLGRMIVCNSSNTAAYAVRGNFYSSMFTNHTALEFPLSDQFFTGVGERQYFEGGFLTWTEAAGTTLTLYASKAIVDNSDSGFTKTMNWVFTPTGDAYGGGYCKRACTGTDYDFAKWDFTITQPGYYDVYVRYPIVSSANPTAIYTVNHSAGSTNVTLSINQTRNNRWNYLGCYQFSTSGARIDLSSKGTSGKYLAADAVRLIGPVNGPDTTPPTTPVVTDDGTHTSNATQLHASWESQDMESGIDHYEYAIGTAPADPGTDYIIPWTSTNIEKAVTVPVSLSQGQTYYFYVRAVGPSGISAVGVSDGIDVGTVSAAIPTVTDDGTYTGDNTALHCSWLSSDTNIARYEYSVGTSPYTSNVVPPTNIGLATQVWATGLNLTTNQSYYFTVRSYDATGTPSNPGCSDGITYQPASPAVSIADALNLPDTTVVILKNKTVSALFSNRFYLNDIVGIRSIAVISSNGLPEASLCDVTGTLSTQAGERIITPGCVTPAQP